MLFKTCVCLSYRKLYRIGLALTDKGRVVLPGSAGLGVVSFGCRWGEAKAGILRIRHAKLPFPVGNISLHG